MCTNKDTRHVLEILAPEGPYEIISIPAEQAAPMADLAAFTEQLSSFVREDYYGDDFSYEKDGSDFAAAGGFTFKGESDDDDLVLDAADVDDGADEGMYSDDEY